jgi:hypothetical protein
MQGYAGKKQRSSRKAAKLAKGKEIKEAFESLLGSGADDHVKTSAPQRGWRCPVANISRSEDRAGRHASRAREGAKSRKMLAKEFLDDELPEITSTRLSTLHAWRRAPQNAFALICGGDFLAGIEDQHFDRAFSRFQFKAQLVLEVDEDRRALLHAFERVFQLIGAVREL